VDNQTKAFSLQIRTHFDKPSPWFSFKMLDDNVLDDDDVPLMMIFPLMMMSR